jgi:hypothetical protein
LNYLLVGLGLFWSIVADIVLPVIGGTVGELAAIAALISGSATRLERQLTRDALILLVILLGVATAMRSFDELNRGARFWRKQPPLDVPPPSDVRDESGH